MNAADTGRPIRAAEVVAAGTLVTTDGRPVVAVSDYPTGAMTDDGRPVYAVSTTLRDGAPVLPISFYAAGTLVTPDGRPVYAVSNYSAAGVRGI